MNRPASISGSRRIRRGGRLFACFTLLVILGLATVGSLSLLPKAAHPGAAGQRLHNYLRLGMWRADRESLLAAARWLIDPVEAASPLVVSNANPTGLTFGTNSSPFTPAA